MKYSEKEIKRRIYNLIPVATLQMQEFLSLLKIEFTNKTESAAITCEVTPSLLLNMDFVNKYCRCDEHLLMLIMHEIYHIILGHNNFFKKVTLIDNIAFDAIINAIIVRKFSEKEYVSFFEKINPSNSFPGSILRPLAEDTPFEARELLHQLYETNDATYYEIYEFIRNHFNEQLIGNHYILIGSHSPFNFNLDTLDENQGTKNAHHGTENKNQDADFGKNETLKKLIENTAIKFDDVRDLIKGRGSHNQLENLQVSGLNETIKKRDNLISSYLKLE